MRFSIVLGFAALLSAAPVRAQAASTQPAIVAMAGGESFLVLRASGAARADGKVAFEVTYWTPSDPRLLDSSTGREQVAADMAQLFEAYRVWCVTMAIEEVDVTATLGKPGALGRSLSVAWRRDGPQSWAHAAPVIGGGAIPSFVPSLERDKATEGAAYAAAEAFVHLIDAGRSQQARDTASDALKSMVTRPVFRAAVEQGAIAYGKTSSRKRLFAMHPAGPGSALKPGALVMLRFATVTEGGEGVEDVAVQREADGTWRVVGYAPRARVPESRMPLVEKQLSKGKK